MMNKITLNDLLGLTPIEIYSANVKLNHRASDANYNDPSTDPLEVFLKDPDELNQDWLLKRTQKKFFKDGQDVAMNFVRINDSKKNIWLLTSIVHITKRYRLSNGLYGYEADVMEEFSKFFGRVIIKYDRDNLGPYAPYRKIKDAKVVAIIPKDCDIRKVTDVMF